MSTEHQKYSTKNQADAISKYAEQHHLSIVRTYEDGGKSGLQLKGRDALTQLLFDVQSGNRDFDHILVYDVSRWGRFQDVDESAYYEFICRGAGLTIHYCAEMFANDGSFLSTLAKNLKRAMAAEYSRELSTKVFVGTSRIVRLGFHPGGIVPIGLRRLVIDESGSPKFVLGKRECKGIRSDRLILIPGPPDEIALVRRIFKLLVHHNKSYFEISQILNADAEVRKFGRNWGSSNILRVLTNEKYIGNNVYARSSGKLGIRRIQNPPEMWVRVEECYKPIIAKELFFKARRIIAERGKLKTDDNVLAELKALLARRGKLSIKIIDDAKLTLNTRGYYYRFGRLGELYQLIGYTGAVWGKYSDSFLLDHLRKVLAKKGRLSQTILTKDTGPGLMTYYRHFGSLKKVYETVGYDRVFAVRDGKFTRYRDCTGRFCTRPQKSKRRR